MCEEEKLLYLRVSAACTLYNDACVVYVTAVVAAAAALAEDNEGRKERKEKKKKGLFGSHVNDDPKAAGKKLRPRRRYAQSDATTSGGQRMNRCTVIS